jgi:hypothetical protein
MPGSGTNSASHSSPQPEMNELGTVSVNQTPFGVTKKTCPASRIARASIRKMTGRLVPEVHRGRVPLVRPNALPVLGKGEALLRAGCHDLLELSPGQPTSVLGACVEQHIDGDPTA